MSSLQDDLFNFLMAQDGIVALAGDRCYRVTPPQEPPAYPCLSYFRVSVTPEYTHDGENDLLPQHFQISCWATSQPDAEALARAVRLAMRGWKAAYNQPAFFLNQVTVPQPETGIYHETLDFEVWHKE